MMNTNWLLIDDKRNVAGVESIARTYKEGKDAILRGGWATIIFDHDLGDTNPKHTGYDLMCILEEHPELIPENIMLITDNPVGLQKMEVLRIRLYDMRNSMYFNDLQD